MLDALVEVAFEVLANVAVEALGEAVSDADQSSRILAGIGHALMGTAAGALSLFFLPRQVAPQVGFPGMSLAIAPLCAGVLLDSMGRWWERRGNVRMALFTFRGGVVFALAMAIVRFVCLRVL